MHPLIKFDQSLQNKHAPRAQFSFLAHLHPLHLHLCLQTQIASFAHGKGF